jgi:hypothetical protein
MIVSKVEDTTTKSASLESLTDDSAQIMVDFLTEVSL